MIGCCAQTFILDDLLDALFDDAVVRDPLDSVPDEIVCRHLFDWNLTTVRENEFTFGETKTFSDGPEILFLFGRLLVDPAVDVHDVLPRLLEQ